MENFEISAIDTSYVTWKLG